ncbi:MAG: type II secretion system secretin GspD [Kiritimatiellia bacterium]
MARFWMGVIAGTALSTGRRAQDLSPGLPVPAAPRSASDAARTVNFNFDNVEIKNLVEVVRMHTGRNFVLDETVSSKKVSVVTSEQIPVSEVYPLFLSVLESSGHTVIEEGDTLRIVPLGKSDLPSSPVSGPDEAMPVSGLVTRLFRVKHIDAVQLMHTLQPMVRGGKEGAIEVFGQTNHLMVTDTAAQMRRIEKVLQILDVEGSSRVVEVIKLKFASCEDLAREVTLAMAGAESANAKIGAHMRQVAAGGGELPAESMLIPSPQSNSLLLIGSPAQLDQARDIIARLDVESETGPGRLRSIKLNYLAAEDIAKTLEALITKSVTPEKPRRISIEPSIANNALIVDASPMDHEHILRLVGELDTAPQQVLVEVMIAEVSDGDQLDLGADWSTIDSPKDGSTTVVARSRPGEKDTILEAVNDTAFPQGFSLGIARGTFTRNGVQIPRVPFILHALAGDRDVRILSKPALLAQNNRKATVSVVDNIPVLKSTVQGGTGSARDVLQNIERMDVGLKLSLTPRVNPENMITLDLNPSIEAVIDEGPADQPFTPTFAKREVTTTVTIPNNATVVITGLLREDEVKEETGVPYLRNIPLLGWLFKHSTTKKQKTNLIIFVTPRLVSDAARAAEMKAEWERNTGITPDVMTPEPDAEPPIKP